MIVYSLYYIIWPLAHLRGCVMSVEVFRSLQNECKKRFTIELSSHKWWEMYRHAVGQAILREISNNTGQQKYKNISSYCFLTEISWLFYYLLGNKKEYIKLAKTFFSFWFIDTLFLAYIKLQYSLQNKK